MDMGDVYTESFEWGHIWDPWFWLPPNLTWTDFQSQEGYVYTTDKHFFALVVPLAGLIGALQYVVQRYCLRPIGVWMGMSDVKTKNRFPQNNVMENAYSSSKKIDGMKIAGLAKQLDWTESQVQQWLTDRVSEEDPTTLEKFCGSGWRCLYFTFSFSIGVATLWNKSWLWDVKECWKGFPLEQSLTDDVFWYYLSATAFTLDLLVLHVFENKKKGYWPLFIHHIATITLLTISWISSQYRVGSLVIFVHDWADVVFEITKMTHYAKFKKTNKITAVICLLSWIATRNVVFPLWIVMKAVEALHNPRRYPAAFLLTSELVVLVILHVFWTIVITITFCNNFPINKVRRDIKHSKD